MFDCFVDTKKKRFALVASLFYAFGIYASILSIVLGYKMININDTTTLFEMVDMIHFHFIGRVLLNAMQSGVVYQSSISIFDMLKILLGSINGVSFFFIVIYACFIVSNKKLEGKRILFFFSLFALTYIVFLTIILYHLLVALNSYNVTLAINSLQIIGYIMILLFIIWIGIFSYFLYICIRKYYLPEFKYQVIEVIEEKDIKNEDMEEFKQINDIEEIDDIIIKEITEDEEKIDDIIIKEITEDEEKIID